MRGDKEGINIQTNSLTVASLGRSTSLIVRGEYKHNVRYFCLQIQLKFCGLLKQLTLLILVIWLDHGLFFLETIGACFLLAYSELLLILTRFVDIFINTLKLRQKIFLEL